PHVAILPPQDCFRPELLHKAVCEGGQYEGEIGAALGAAENVAEFCLIHMAARFDDLLRIYVFGYSRELEKCRKLERDQLFDDDDSDQHMLSSCKQKAALKRRVAHLMWKCFLLLTSSAASTGLLEPPSVETFLELCSNDVDLAVKLAAMLLEVEPQVALCLAALWDASKAHAAIKETMKQIREVVTGCADGGQGNTSMEAGGSINAEDASVLEVFEYRKKLAFLFIDNDVLASLVRLCERCCVLATSGHETAQNLQTMNGGSTLYGNSNSASGGVGIVVGDFIQNQGLGGLINRGHASLDDVEEVSLLHIPDPIVATAGRGSALQGV
ncbi:unnamed protein product, partial [Amoebophrya sp. A25]